MYRLFFMERRFYRKRQGAQGHGVFSLLGWVLQEDAKEVLEAAVPKRAEAAEQRVKALLREAAMRNVSHGEKDDMSAIYVIVKKRGGIL